MRIFIQEIAINYIFAAFNMVDSIDKRRRYHDREKAQL